MSEACAFRRKVAKYYGVQKGMNNSEHVRISTMKHSLCYANEIEPNPISHLYLLAKSIQQCPKYCVPTFYSLEKLQKPKIY